VSKRVDRSTIRRSAASRASAACTAAWWTGREPAGRRRSPAGRSAALAVRWRRRERAALARTLGLGRPRAAGNEEAPFAMTVRGTGGGGTGVARQPAAGLRRREALRQHQGFPHRRAARCAGAGESDAVQRRDDRVFELPGRTRSNQVKDFTGPDAAAIGSVRRVKNMVADTANYRDTLSRRHDHAVTRIGESEAVADEPFEHTDELRGQTATARHAHRRSCRSVQTARKHKPRKPNTNSGSTRRAANQDGAWCSSQPRRGWPIWGSTLWSTRPASPGRQVTHPHGTVTATVRTLRTRHVRHRARYERALVYLGQGQKRKAREELERVYAEDSSLPHVNQALTELND